jgi:hypothetical protein
MRYGEREPRASPSPSRLARSATVAGSIFVLTWAAGKVLDVGVSGLWRSLSRPIAILVLLVALIALSVSAAVLAGRISLPARKAQLWLSWAVRQLPFTLRDLLSGRRVSRGRGNQRWPSLAHFEAEDSRRIGGRRQPQCDYGKHWRDGDKYINRLTHVLATGEVIAVEEGSVELLATIPSEHRVEALLENHAYVCLFHHDIRWVRCRLAEWRTPLPPKSRWWLEEDQKPLTAWPGPPPPSVGRKVGAYHGRSGAGAFEVLCVDEAGERPLYHAVEDSPTGYSWGYTGAGPTDMAGSLLLDRLGYVPQHRIVFDFRDDVVAQLPPDFVLTYADVDAWIDDHGELFAADPRAVPLDPFAAGGAYDDKPE